MAPLPAGNILSEHKYAQDIAQGYSSQLHDHYGNSILAFDEGNFGFLIFYLSMFVKQYIDKNFQSFTDD